MELSESLLAYAFIPNNVPKLTFQMYPIAMKRRMVLKNLKIMAGHGFTRAFLNWILKMCINLMLTDEWKGLRVYRSDNM